MFKQMETLQSITNTNELNSALHECVGKITKKNKKRLFVNFQEMFFLEVSEEKNLNN